MKCLQLPRGDIALALLSARCPLRLFSVNSESTFTWTIAEFDATVRTSSYGVNVCNCDNVGTVEIIEGVSYMDDNSSTSAYPVVPSSIQVQVTDNTGYCGTPGVGLGE